MKQLDKVDLAILDKVQQDGRVSNAKLAEALNLSETPCWRRLKKLEEEQYIDDYQANLNRRKLGLSVMAFVYITCTAHDELTSQRLEQIILSSDNILSCHNTTGDADYILQVVAEDLDDFSRFVEQVLRKLPGVSSLQSNLSLREVKASSRLPVKV